MKDLISILESMKEKDFLSSKDLVGLGLWSSENAAYEARKRGQSPHYCKMGRRVIYPKQSVIDFILQRMKKGYGEHEGNI